MCGIFGILNFGSPRRLDVQRFDKALATLAHRGPDGQKSIALGNEAIFGHRRLSIIDLSDGSAQPMQAEGRYWLTYNGELFNYVELREELKSLGVRFLTFGDTEVVLQAYIKWGSRCVERFNGMWAFAIYDTTKKLLFCSRDRFGEKPFNYAILDGQFYFASEIKAMLSYEPRLARPNYEVISNFCRSSVGAQHAQTWFDGIERLPPACNAFVCDGKVKVERYWSYPEQVDNAITFEEARAQYASLFRDAVRLRLRSDVPVGLTLSAGLDSSSIAYMMKAEGSGSYRCFTASFEDGEAPVRDSAIFSDDDSTTDEAVEAERTASELALPSVVERTNYANFVPALGRIIYHLESGNSSPAVIPLMQLMRRASLDLKVVLEGQGADELLGGYVGNLVWQYSLDLAIRRRFRDAWQTLRAFGTHYKLSYAFLMSLRYVSNFLPVLSRMYQRCRGIDRVFGPRLREYRHMQDFPPFVQRVRGSGVGRMLLRQHAGGLVNLLHYGDAVSMANGVESRMPFLDHRLVEFVWRLPSDYKLRMGVGKALHRAAMRGIVPDRIIDNPIKYGFCTPVNEQFRKPQTDADPERGPVAVLLSDRCIERGLFDRTGLLALISDHRSGKRDHGPLLFRLLSTELWFREFIDESNSDSRSCASMAVVTPSQFPGRVGCN